MAKTQQAPPKIAPPFGYSEVAVLKRTDRVRLPAPGAIPEFCRSTNALALSLGEFPVAARDYPIVFASGGTAKPYAPVIVLGLADRQNLFVDAAGAWDAAAYVPAYLRRYPFCISRLHAEGEQEDRKVICVARAHLHRQGTVLFDAEGTPTPRWQAARRLLEEYENDLDATARMCALLRELDLFAPFAVRIARDASPQLTLQGMHRIDEDKLKALAPDRLRELVTRGLMGAIYAHIHSLENFARLYQRATARSRSRARPKRK